MELKVKPMKQKDAGRGLIAVDSAVMEEQGIEIGDYLVIRNGNNKEILRAYPGYPEDEGKQRARCDGIVRKNLGVEIDQRVEAEVFNPKPAELVVIARSKELRYQGSLKELFKNHLSGKAVVGDKLVNINPDSKKNQWARVQVYIVETVPSEGCIIHEGTEIELSERPTEYWTELRKHSILYRPIKKFTIYTKTLLYRLPRILVVTMVLMMFVATVFTISYLLSIATEPGFLSWLTGLSSLSLVLVYIMNVYYQYNNSG